MNQRIGDDFADGDGREQGRRIADDAALLRRWHDGVDVVVHRDETHGVAMREVLALENLGIAAGAVIHHEANGLACEAVVDHADVFGEKDGAEVQDVPTTTDVGRDGGALGPSPRGCFLRSRALACRDRRSRRRSRGDRAPVRPPESRARCRLPRRTGAVCPHKARWRSGWSASRGVASPMRTKAVRSNSMGAVVADGIVNNTSRPSGCWTVSNENAMSGRKCCVNQSSSGCCLVLAEAGSNAVPVIAWSPLRIPPDDVAGLSVCDTGGVRQCGNQPPDALGFDIVLLEFGPGDLCGQGAQLVYQGDGAGIGHGPVAPGCMI